MDQSTQVCLWPTEVADDSFNPGNAAWGQSIWSSRTDPTAALGEQVCGDLADDTFVSLGYGGSIV